jgi:hypothetical protein
MPYRVRHEEEVAAMEEYNRKASLFSADDFAHLGGGELAYIREMEAGKAGMLYPEARLMPPKARLFVLHAADGTPILLGNDRNNVMANAREHALNPVYLH